MLAIMLEKIGGDIMEQRQLPIVLFIMAFFLAVGFSIKEIDSKYFNIPQMLTDFHEWMQWKLMPGW
jgi:hypothetical protein